MKIFEDRDDVLVGGAESIETFTIKASAQAFTILSSSLYSNRIGAVIRELSTNAYDAHVMVGTPTRPFEITIPNSLEPSFKIRDFGPGLSEKEISSIYTTFFESTKTESNDVIGCLGLGSKSPFAVSDNFTITSYYNGVKTIYSAFLSDARIPSIAKFAHFPCDDENGLEIEVAIKERDFYTFKSEVNSQLKYFKVKPIIRGSSDFAWHPDEEYLYEGENWKLIRGNGHPRILQGQIQYPIALRDMGTAYTDASDEVKAILEKAVLIEVAIGEVNIAPSRESLTYDSRTCANIIKAAEKIVATLPQMINVAIEKADSEYEARLLFMDIMTALSRPYAHHNALLDAIKNNGGGTWRGKDISNSTIEIKQDKIIGISCFSRTAYGCVFKKNNYYAYLVDPHGDERVWHVQVTDLKTTIWLHVKTTDTSVDARAKQYAAQNHKSGVRLTVIKTDLPTSKLARLLGLKVSDVVVASDLPKVKRTASTKSKNVVSVDKFTPNNYDYKKSSRWVSMVVPSISSLTGYYVDLERYDVKTPDNTTESDFKGLVSACVELGFIASSDSIYGLRPANRKGTHNLVNLFDHIATEITSGKYDIVRNVFSDGAVITKFANNINLCETVLPLLTDSSPLKNVVVSILAGIDNKYNGNVCRFIRKYNLFSRIVDFSQVSNEIESMYPMIGLLGYYYDREIIAQYIKQMESSLV
jgi:hypothetical protein